MAKGRPRESQATSHLSNKVYRKKEPGIPWNPWRSGIGLQKTNDSLGEGLIPGMGRPGRPQIDRQGGEDDLGGFDCGCCNCPAVRVVARIGENCYHGIVINTRCQVVIIIAYTYARVGFN